MASMLYLGNTVCPHSKPVCIPSTSVSNVRETKLHFRLSHPSPSLISTSKYTRRGQPGQAFHPVTCIHEDRSSRPIRKDENDNKIARGFAGASVFLAGALSIIGAGFRMNSRALADHGILPPPQLQEASNKISGVKDVALYQSPCNPTKLESPGSPPSQLPDLGPSIEDVEEKIISEAERLIKENKLKEAEKFLQDTYNGYVSNNYTEAARRVDLELVKLLIKMEKYLSASKRDCLKPDQIILSDPEPLLYKAFISAMLRRRAEAKKWWDRYMEALEEAGGLPDKPQ